MSKTEIELPLLRPLDETLLARLVRAHAIYGLMHLRPSPSGQALRVTYDATRLTEQDVVSELRRLGLPVSLPHPNAVPNRA